MKRFAIHGIRCARKDERALMTRVNEHLAKLSRTTSKTKNPSLLAKFEPYELKHYYWNLNRPLAAYFEIYPNEDAKKRLLHPSHPESGWLIHTRMNELEELEQARAYLGDVMRALGFEVSLLFETDDEQEEYELYEAGAASSASS